MLAYVHAYFAHYFLRQNDFAQAEQHCELNAKYVEDSGNEVSHAEAAYVRGMIGLLTQDAEKRTTHLRIALQANIHREPTFEKLIKKAYAQRKLDFSEVESATPLSD